MELALRLKARLRDGSPGTITTTIYVDPDFYTLESLIELVDECVYGECDVDLLTAAAAPFTLNPRRYSAISVVQEDE